MKKVVLAVAASIAIAASAGISAQNTPLLLAQVSTDQQEYQFIVDSWDGLDYQDFLTKYPNSPYAKEIKARFKELILWGQAQEENSQEAYQKYLDKTEYGKFTDQAKDAMEALRSQSMQREWQVAAATNSIEAYQDFKKKYPASQYVYEADKRINSIKALNEWDKIKDSGDIEVIEEFIYNYPSFPDMMFAKSRLHALKMEDYFDRNEIASASEEFDLIEIGSAVPESAMIAYGAVEEYNRFHKLSERSSESELLSFLSKYPGTQYKADVNNYIALNKAARFNTLSTKDDYNAALSFATGKTANIVQQYIKNNDKLISTEKALASKRRRDANGGWLGLVIEYLDANWNGRDELGLFRYDFGLKFRVGNYADRIQGAIGVKPGVGVWDFKGIFNRVGSDYDSGKVSAFFEMPIEAELKINLAKTGYSTWMYVDGRFDYNVIRQKEVERPAAFTVGLGWAGRTWDFLMYYGMQLGNVDEYLNQKPNPFNDNKTKSYFGISLSSSIRLY